MTITYHSDAKIKIERGTFVVTRAFDIAGQFHDIVISDGSQALTKDNLNVIGESKLRKLAQDIFDGCLLSADEGKASPQTPLENRLFIYKKKFNEESFEGEKVEMVVHPDGTRYKIGKKDIIELFTHLNDFLGTYGRVDFTEGSLEKGDKSSAPEAKPTSWVGRAVNAVRSLPLPAAFGGTKNKAPQDAAKDPEKGAAPVGQANTPSEKPAVKKGHGGVNLSPDLQKWLKELSREELLHFQQEKGRRWLDEELKNMPHLNPKLREAFKTAICAGIKARIEKLSK